MCKLLKKDTHYWWDEACEKSFQWMKTTLITLPHSLSLTGQHVHTNASNYAIGAMLVQNLDNTIDKPIYHAND
jgi:hypothetical protein